MPDEIKPDESLDEQPQPGSEAAINAVADESAGVDNEAGEEAGAESADQDNAQAEDDIEATMRRMLEEDADTPLDGTSQPDSEDDFPDLSRVKMEEPVASPAEFQQLTPSSGHKGTSNIDLLLDVRMPVSIELGRTDMPISEILTLGPGSVVELDKLAGEPVDLLVNDKIIAKGEVVVVDENFGVRITMLMSPEERLKSLAKQ